MANWKVARESCELLKHPNADSLEILKLGARQYVVQKGLYQNGEIVISVPVKSLLPNNLTQGFEKYLGPQNRVRQIRLRGELSEGLILRDQQIGDIGEDISVKLGIVEWTPPVPSHLAGDVVSLGGIYAHKHDVDQARIYENEFVNGELVLVTEKLHGTQGNLGWTREGGFWVSSKGVLKQGLSIRESETNLYWQCVNNSPLQEIVLDYAKDESINSVQICFEALPSQKGYGYGLTKPTPKVFKVLIDGQVTPYNDLAPFHSLWCPVIAESEWFDGIGDHYRNGKEQVSGKELHTREGVVITPKVPRRNKDNSDLAIKYISDAYAKKETGDELS